MIFWKKKHNIDTADDASNNPWAGLSSYQDPETAEVKLKFCGRDNESYDVTRLIDDNIFVTLYGKSGTGKTSLLNAGVFPRLRQEQYLPVSIRLGMDAMGISFQKCIITKIGKALEGKGTVTSCNVVPMPIDEQSTEYLWSYFARSRFSDLNGNTIFPVLVFDQFEEIFRKRQKDADALLRQIHFMMDESHALTDRVVDGTNYSYDFNFRFIVAIREDDLYRLEDSIDNNYLPEMKRCRYRLRSLTEQGARDAILIPGEGLFNKEDEDKIVRTIILIAKNRVTKSISTNLLSLICSRIYVDYLKSGETHISPTLVDSFLKGNPFERFYKEATRGLSNKEKSYIEDHLVDSSGRRNSISESDFMLNIKNGSFLLHGNERILQRISVPSDVESYRIELIHDVFCLPLIGQKEKRQLQKRSQITMFSLVCAIVVIGIIWYYLNTLQEANDQMKYNEIIAKTEKIQSLSDYGDSYNARRVTIDLIKNNLKYLKEKWVPEVEAAIRYANKHENAVLTGHKAAVSSVCFNGTGSTIMSTSYDRTIRLWDTETGKLGKEIKLGNDTVEQAVFTPDGNSIVCGCTDNSIKIISLKTKKIEKILKGHKGPVNCVAITAKGGYIASASYDNTIKIWNVRTGKVERSFEGHNDCVEGVAFSKDENNIVSVSKDKTIRIWDLQKGICIDTIIHGHKDGIRSVAFSPDGKRFVTTSDDKTAKVWDIATRRCLTTLSGHKEIVYGAQFSHDGKYIATGSYDTTVRLWDSRTGACVDILKGHTMYVTSPSFSPDDRLVVSGSVDNTIRIWEVPKHNLCLKELDTVKLSSAAYHPMIGTRIALATKYGGLIIKEGKYSFPMKGHTAPVNIVVFSPYGKELLSSSYDKTIKVWDANKKKCKKQIILETTANTIKYSPDNRFFAAGMENGSICVWDATKYEIKYSMMSHNTSICDIDFSSDGQRLVSLSTDGRICIWDIQTGKRINCIDTHHKGKGHIIYGINDNLIFSSQDDKNIYVIDSESGIQRNFLAGHTARIYGLTLSEDGRYIASTSHDKTVKVWDAASGVCVMSEQLDQFSNVAFHPNGDQLLLISLSDQKAYTLPFVKWKDLLKLTYTRFGDSELTEEERKLLLVR